MKRLSILLLALVLFTGVSSATITSVDSVTYNSNREFFSGEVYAISVSNDQATDEIDIFLGQSQLEQSTDGEVNQDLTIDFTDQNTELQYSTTPSSNLRDVYTFVPYSEKGFESKEDAVSAIKANCFDLDGSGEGSGGYNQYYDASSFSYDWRIYCFQKDKYLGTPAYLDNPEEVFTADVELQASGKQVQTATLSNGDAGQGRTTNLGQHAKIMWNGNLGTGASKPDNSRVYALHANRYSGSWRIVNQQAYEDYKTYVGGGSAFDSLEDWASGQNTGWQAAEWLNDRAWSAAEVDKSSDLAYTTVADSSLNSGAFSFDTEDLLVYPTFTVYVDAGENGYIEVSKPTGKPSITSTSSEKIQELGTGQLDVSVRNTGDAEGSFSARITSCSNGFTFSDTQRTKMVNAGESVSYGFDVSFQSTSREQREIGGSCTVEVEDTGSGVSDSTSVEVTGVQASECSAGHQKATLNEDGLWEIYQCKDNEQGWRSEPEATCDEGQKAYAQGDNKFACEEAGSGSGGGSGGWSFPWSFGGSGSDGGFLGNGLLDQVHLGFSLVAGLLVSVVGYRGSRWVDGEHQVQGSFSPLQSRGLDRVSRGRLVIGVIGAVIGFVAGTFLALQIPLLVQVIMIAGLGLVKFYSPW